MMSAKITENPMSWLPSNDPVLGDPKSCDALELVIVPRTRDLGDGFRGAPRAAARQAADGRPLHLLRSFRAGAVHVRQGHGRAPASAYRARHRHLSVRRQHHAPRQRGQHPGNPARRHEPDDGRARHRPFRAHAGRAAEERPEDAGPAKLDRAAGRHRRRSRRRFSITPPPICRRCKTAALPRASSPAARSA